MGRRGWVQGIYLKTNCFEFFIAPNIISKHFKIQQFQNKDNNCKKYDWASVVLVLFIYYYGNECYKIYHNIKKMLVITSGSQILFLLFIDLFFCIAYTLLMQWYFSVHFAQAKLLKYNVYFPKLK